MVDKNGVLNFTIKFEAGAKCSEHKHRTNGTASMCNGTCLSAFGRKTKAY